MLPFQTENGNQVIFPNPFTVCPCVTVNQETNGNYPFANGLTRRTMTVYMSRERKQKTSDLHTVNIHSPLQMARGI
jgi:hypothetical protein